MATVSEYVRRRAEEERKKQQKSQTTQTTQSQSKVSDFVRRRAEEERKKLAGQVSAGKDVTDPGLTGGAAEQDQERTWFQSGALKDGVNIGTLDKAVAATSADASQNLWAGILGIGEKFVDSLAALAPYATQGMQNAMGGNPLLSPQELQTQQQMLQNNEALMSEFISKDLYDEKKIAQGLLTLSPTQIIARMKGVDVEKDSVLGEKSDALIQSAGQLAAQFGIGLTGVPWWLTSGVSGFGGEVENALKQDASLDAAVGSGIISAGAEVLTEKLFGGDIFTKKAGMGQAATYLSRAISNKTARTLAKYGLDLAGESAEEVFSQVISNLGSALYRKENLGQILFSEEALDGYIESAVGGAVLGAGMGAINVGQAKAQGKDFASDLTMNEKAVVDKVYKDALAEQEQGGKKLSERAKNKLYNDVIGQMDRGEISVNTIEEVLGDRSKYETLSKEAKEFDELYNTESGKLSQKQMDRLAELGAKNKQSPYAKAMEAADSEIRKNVEKAVAEDRLAESYRERVRKNQAFVADVNEYTGKARKIVQKAMDSGVLNNTNRSHELVDLIARIGADKDVDFDFADNKKLKESGFAIQNGTVNGLYSDSGITINVESAKALNSVVGHEVAHVLEGSQLYEAMAKAVTEYAKGKGEYDSRLKSITKLYQQMESYRGEGSEQKIQRELVADLVGDYLFTDKDFVERLSTEDRNVFQKIYDEVKYLCRVATAGTEEARQLEKVKKTFEDAYRKAQKSPTGDGGVRYALGSSNAQKNITANYQKTVDSILQGTHTDKSSVLLGYTPDVYQELGMPSLPFVIGPGHIYSTVKTEAEARLENRYNKKMHYHGLGDNAVKNIYNAAQDPLMIIASKDVNPKTTPLRSAHSVVAIVDLGTGNQHLLLPVEITAKRTVNGEEMDVNVLSSAYNKNVSELVREAVALENIGEVGVYYIKKGATLPADSGVQFPVHLSNKIASGGIIHSFSEKVNMNISNATQSQQFKRWFGDWQNHPESASKIVNADGTPKVVYHGTNADFTVFQSTDGNYWFSESEDYAEAMMEERGGDKLMHVYLNMRNPYVTSLQADQFSNPVYESPIIRNAKANGYDGVIIENETDNDLAYDKFYIVFNPEQIKSATGNVGTFNGSNPDINYSLSTKNTKSANGVAQPGGGWQIMGEDVARKDVPILDQLAEEQAAKTQAKGQDADISVLEQLIEERLQAEQTELDEEYRRQVENPDEASKTAGQRSDVADKPVTTVKQRLERKLRNLNTELKNNQRHRQEANQAYTEQIAAAQKAYDGKPHKESKAAQKLLRRIQRLTRLQADADAEYEKRIHDIEKRIEKVNDQLLDDYTEQDRLDAINQRIDRQLEADIEDTKKRYRDRFNKEKANLGNRIQFIKRNATTLYNEITGRKKGDRLSRNLFYLLDLGYDWQELQVAAARVNQSPTLPVQKESSAENAVRELFGEQFEERSIDLEDGMVKKYNDEIEELQKKAAQKKEEAKISEQRRQKQDTYAQEVAELAGDTSTWVDKKVGISYQTNTLRRNLRDVVRDEKGNKDIAKADALYEYLQGDYNRNEAEMNREIDRVKRPYADLKITKEESVYIQMLGEFRHNPDTELMPDMVEEYYEAHKKKIDKEKVDRVIEMARKTYDDLLKRVNAVLREQGMKEIPYREGYFPHFTEDKQSWLAKLLNWKTQNNDIPTDIAGITEQFNPNRSWQSFNKERTSDTTDYNFLKGMDNYVRGAMDWIYHLEDIQRNRAFENHLRYVHSEAGIQERIDAIRDDTAFDAEEAQKQMESVWNEAKNPLGNLVQDLRTRTNLLAGKKHSADRGVEAAINRKVYSTMTNISSRVSANMVAGSVSSALTNFIPITQSWGQVSPEYSLNAMGDTIRSYISDDGNIERSAFLTNRLKKADALYKTGWDKASNVVGFMMEAVDNFTSQTVWRSKYLQNISEGMSEAQAIRDADQFAENVIAGRSRGNMPTIFESKNPITRVFTAFQLEVANQYGYMFKDMPNDVKNQSMARLLKGYAAMYMGAYAYNALYSSLVGRDAAFDPIGIIEELLGDLGFGDDEEEEEPADVILNLADNVLEEVPFVGGLLGGGRIPISSALPYDGIYEAFQGTVQDVADRNWKNLTWEWMNPAFYLVSPMMGGQIRKSAQGIGMFLGDKPVSGSYTDSGKLRFPVEANAKNVFQAAIFGQWASKTAQEYFDQKRTPLTQEQIDEFLQVDIPIYDYWEYREGLSKLNKKAEGGKASIAEQGDYIASLDLPVEKKNILINNLAKRKEPIDMSTYDQYPNFEQFDYGTKNPGLYAISKTMDSFEDFLQYREDLNKIEADKDSDGETISGSRKEKVLDYINGLDIGYEQKLLLYKSKYKSDNSYNYQILQFLNDSELSYEETAAALEALGFKVAGNGSVTW